MKNRIQKIGEEIVPLSRKQSLVLLLLIACVFQFVLFFTPALAAETVAEQDELQITLGSVNKSAAMEVNAQKIANTIPVSEIVVKPELVANTTTKTTMVTDSEAITPSIPFSTSTVESIINTATSTRATTTPGYKVKSTSVHVMTAYNSEVGQTDNSPCITANGFDVCKHGKEDTIAANFLKFGTKVKIPELYGDRIFVVRDRMNVKHPNRVDIWMKDRPSAMKFGVKTAKIQVLE